MPLTVFISYRRDDTSPLVDALQDELERRLPEVRVLRDVDLIAPADDYVRVLQEAIDEAELFLAVMGKGWAGESGGSRRIDDPGDVVRREIRWRLRPADSSTVVLGGPGGSRIEEHAAPAGRGPLLPVLVGGATMPAEAALPPDIRALARRNAVMVPAGPQGDWDLGPLLAEVAERARAFREEEDRTTAMLEELMEQALEDAGGPPGAGRAPGAPAAGGGPAPSPDVQVALSDFSHRGAWVCEVEPATPGGGGGFTLEFQVRSDDSLSGRLLTRHRRLLGTRTREEPVEGRARLLFFRPAGSDGLHPVLRLEGVRGRAAPFHLEIPVERRLGRIFVGSDGTRTFSLRQVRGHGL